MFSKIASLSRLALNSGKSIKREFLVFRTELDALQKQFEAESKLLQEKIEVEKKWADERIKERSKYLQLQIDMEKKVADVESKRADEVANEARKRADVESKRADEVANEARKRADEVANEARKRAEEAGKRADAQERVNTEQANNFASLQSRFQAVIAMRPIFEMSLRNMPRFSNVTAAWATVYEDLSTNQRSQVQQWINDLEGPSGNPSAVWKELQNLYHELSKGAHAIRVIPELPHGLVCGEDSPLRVATGIAFLQFQKNGWLHDDINYVKNGKITGTLSKGAVIPFKTEPISG